MYVSLCNNKKNSTLLMWVHMGIQDFGFTETEEESPGPPGFNSVADSRGRV